MININLEKIVRIIRNKKKLEKLLNIKITNKGKDVSFEGSPEDEFVATMVFEALEMGFSFSDASLIKEKELEFDRVNIKNFARRGNMEKIRGRLIGKNGTVLKALSELTKCSFEMKGNEVGIIGDPENIKFAIDAVIQIIQGSKHANVYRGLEKRKDDPIIDLGLKEKK